MFPPKETNDVEKWLQGLWESLQRAGGQFKDVMGKDAEGDTVVATIFLAAPIPERGKTSLTNYIKSYSKACGWKVTKVKYERGYVRIAALGVGSAAHASRKPASSLSTNSVTNFSKPRTPPKP